MEDDVTKRGALRGTVQGARLGALRVVRRLREAGFEAYFAGGCVRDILLGLDPKDYDIVTSARPEAVVGLFRRTVLVGVSFGVVRVSLGDDRVYEVATYRCDGEYSDGRRPDTVAYGLGKEDDVQRRDFTVNALLLDPETEEVIDLVGGRADLERKLIRAVGDPAQRFAEDHLRMLRAVRFAVRFGFDIEPRTLSAIEAAAPQIVRISVERIAGELEGIWSSSAPGRGLRLLFRVGLLPYALPFLRAIQDTSSVASKPDLDSRPCSCSPTRVVGTTSAVTTATATRTPTATQIETETKTETESNTTSLEHKAESLARLPHAALGLPASDVVVLAWAILLDGFGRREVDEALRGLKRPREVMRRVGLLHEAAPVLRHPSTHARFEALRIVADARFWPIARAFQKALLEEGSSASRGLYARVESGVEGGSSEPHESPHPRPGETDAVRVFRELERDLELRPLPSRPLVDGADLLAMGLVAGPAFKDVLEAVDREVLERRVASRASALEFAAQLARARGLIKGA